MIWLVYRRFGGRSRAQVRRRSGERWFVMDNGDSVHIDQIIDGRRAAEALPIEKYAARPVAGALTGLGPTNNPRRDV